jgi:hypothetical protein
MLASNLEAATRNWPQAYMAVKQGDAPAFFLPVAFVFDTPRGFVWIEPGYLDPFCTSRPMMHEGGFLKADGRLFTGTTPNGHALELGDAYPEEHPEIERSFAGFDRLLQANGTTKDRERERLRALLAEQGLFEPTPADD